MKDFNIRATIFCLTISILFNISCKKSNQNKLDDKWTTIVSIDKPDSRFLDIDFKDEYTGYALSVEGVKGDQSIWVTHDGGKTWHQNSFVFKGVPLTSIAINGNTLFATGKYIYSSIDEGLSWTSIYPYLEWYGPIVFLNDDIGIASRGGNIISRSVDGGQTWAEVFSSNLMAPFVKYFFTDNNTGYTIAGATYDNTNFGVVAKTTDGGLTWNILPGQFANITDIFFLSDRTGYVFTFNSELFKTIDGGDTWKLISNHVPDNHLSSYVLSEKEAYLGGTSGIFYTSDGGITWKQEHKEQGLIVNRIAYNGKSLFAVTNNGKILTKKIN